MADNARGELRPPGGTEAPGRPLCSQPWNCHLFFVIIASAHHVQRARGTAQTGRMGAGHGGEGGQPFLAPGCRAAARDAGVPCHRVAVPGCPGGAAPPRAARPSRSAAPCSAVWTKLLAARPRPEGSRRWGQRILRRWRPAPCGAPRSSSSSSSRRSPCSRARCGGDAAAGGGRRGSPRGAPLRSRLPAPGLGHRAAASAAAGRHRRARTRRPRGAG